MTNPEKLFLERLEMAFDDLRRLLDAQEPDLSRDGRFLLDDVETDVVRLLRHGLTPAELAEITATEIAQEVESIEDYVDRVLNNHGVTV